MELVITASLFALVWACLALCARPADFRAELGLEPADRRRSCPARRDVPCLKGLGHAGHAAAPYCRLPTASREDHKG